MQLFLKRSIDLLLAASLLPVLSPLMGAIALLVKATSPGDALFRQTRVGKDGRPFTIYKFRTMVNAAPPPELDPHPTRLGALLRRSSLDELPQLFNIVKGDMSFVGPRPDLPRHVEKYTPFQRQRLQMRPGITGWAQVNGRNQIPWEERIELDVDYVRSWSLLRDLGIVFSTIGVVLAGRGADSGRKGSGSWEKRSI
ncbi:sugar transferase [Anaeromyxobacter terrae]|uniref:sugar transferase n=1 Tax=Anaeromyxobacter terrae TaxID=2925406 RepID=UPI001F55F545|nr:sugar transferase [Anaeromyxobacter sp. SG22]